MACSIKRQSEAITGYLLILTPLTPLVAQEAFSASTPYHLNSNLLVDTVRHSV